MIKMARLCFENMFTFLAQQIARFIYPHRLASRRSISSVEVAPGYDILPVADQTTTLPVFDDLHID
jgi:hypothetical protein